MKKAALAGAVALATIGSFSLSPGVGIAPAAAQDMVITEAQIAQLKNALHLSAEQERHWHAVAATLRALAHQNVRVASADGFVARTRSRLGDYAITAMSLQRVKSAAAPLIRTLSDEQKHAGLSVLQSMGVTF
jgi:hypothetical protein